MKKYFMTDSNKELKFGDVIMLNLTKDLPNNNIKHLHFECKFIPELIPLLLDENIIRIENTDNKNTDSNKYDNVNNKVNHDFMTTVNNTIKNILDIQKMHQVRLGKLETTLNTLSQMLSANVPHYGNTKKKRR